MTWRIAIATALFITLPEAARASVELCPPATRENIAGVWEAVDPAQVFRVFRLDLKLDGLSTLTEGMPQSTYIPAFGATATSIDLNDGNVLIEFQTAHKSMVGLETIEDGKPYVSTGRRVLKGFARICDESNAGTLTGTLTLEPGSRSPRIWTLTLFKRSGETLGEAILKMERNAADLAEKLQRGVVPESPPGR